MSLDWIGDSIGALTGLGLGIADAVNQNKLNKWQQEFAEKQFNQQQENWQTAFDYQRNLNNQIMTREDTAVQRRVADLEKAGMSKWLAAGQGASSTPLSTSNGAVGGQNANTHNMDLKGSIMAGINVAQQVQGITNSMTQRQNTIADTTLKSAEANTQRKEALLKEAQELNVRKNTEKQSKEIEEINKRLQKIDKEMRSLDVQNSTLFYNLQQSLLLGLRTTDQLNGTLNWLKGLGSETGKNMNRFLDQHNYFSSDTHDYIRRNSQ